jgi:hypothetical protein
MFEDPIVEEIRRARHALAARFNNDLSALVAHLRRSQQESGRTYVSFPPRRIEKKPGPIEGQSTSSEATQSQ